MHKTKGSLLFEIGTHGNTHIEALRSVEYLTEGIIKTLNKKSGFAAPPAAEVRSNIAFHKPVAFLKSYAFQKKLHGNIIKVFTV